MPEGYYGGLIKKPSSKPYGFLGMGNRGGAGSGVQESIQRDVRNRTSDMFDSGFMNNMPMFRFNRPINSPMFGAFANPLMNMRKLGQQPQMMRNMFPNT